MSCLLRRSLLVPQDAPASAPAPDPRSLYDVQLYRLDLEVRPDKELLLGRVGVEAKALAELSTLELDVGKELDVAKVRRVAGALADGLDGDELRFERDGTRLRIALGEPAAAGATVRVSVEYSGSPQARGGFSGFHWKKTPSGEPWINTSCQGPGAHSWWPCKASFFHPEDKPDEGTITNLLVPKGLVGVSNGRLLGHDEVDGGAKVRWRWRHPYPLETYSVTLNVGPYVHEEHPLDEKALGLASYQFWVLPEDLEKARLQFQDVPGMIAAYTKAFGPFPFPRSKFALVQTNFWGMEHSTAVAYGSSFPAWCKKTGARDPYAGRNRWFDYILVHECAHEWWGNGVSASDWGDFWIHEGFATYAEGVYVESTRDRESADRWFASIERFVGPGSRVYRGKGKDSASAYAPDIYYKGAWVLHTLRSFIDDDDKWWALLKEFNLEYRYRNAGTEDFRKLVEERTDRDWKTFFQEFVYGTGLPITTGTATLGGGKLRVEVESGGRGAAGFHLPLDLSWTDGKTPHLERVWLEPGKNVFEVETGADAKGLELRTIKRILGQHHIEVEGEPVGRPGSAVPARRRALPR
ncbi:MAG: M1 family metallopeptidase [Planctomycetota bacterium]